MLLTVDKVLDSWVIVLLKAMYLNNLIAAKNTKIAITFLLAMAL